MLESQIPFAAIIPSLGYESTFSDAEVIEYTRFLTLAASRVTLNFKSPSEEAFLAAGQFIAESADVLVAVWDGKMAKGLGGTGDVVAYARSQNKAVIHFDTTRQIVEEYI
jgi:hypothetical protein